MMNLLELGVALLRGNSILKLFFIPINNGQPPMRRSMPPPPPPRPRALVLACHLAACEAELVASAEAEAEAGFPGQKESELAVVRALLRLILSPNVRMPLSRLQ